MSGAGLLRPDFAPAPRSNTLPDKDIATTLCVAGLALILRAVRAGLIGLVRRIRGCVNLRGIAYVPQRFRRRIVRIERRERGGGRLVADVQRRQECAGYKRVIDERAT